MSFLKGLHPKSNSFGKPNILQSCGNWQSCPNFFKMRHLTRVTAERKKSDPMKLEVRHLGIPDQPLVGRISQVD